MVTVMTPQKEEFLRIIFNATPVWLREYCALVEADPEVTQDILEFIRALRVYADSLPADQAARASTGCYLH